MSDQPAVLLVDDRDGEPDRAAGGARAAAVPAACRSTLRRGGAEGAAARRLRGRAARRADAGHGRLRDGRADQGPRAHAHAADHLRHRDQQGARPRLPRLLGRRGRLRLQAVRPRASCARRSRSSSSSTRSRARRPAARRSCARRSTTRRSGWRGWTSKGAIDEVNRALAELLGQRPADLRDRLLDDFVHPTTRRRCDARLPIGRRRSSTRRGCSSPRGEAVPCAAELLARAAGRRPARRDRRPGAGPARAPRGPRPSARERVREQAARAEAERTSARLTAVQRISDAALGTLAFDDLVRELLKRIVEALEADTAAVVLNEARRRRSSSTRRGEAAAPVPPTRQRRHRRRPNGIKVGSLLARGRGLHARGAAGRRRRDDRRAARRHAVRPLVHRGPRGAARSSPPTAPRSASSARGCSSASTGSPRSCSAACCPAQLPAAARASRPPRATSPPATAPRSAATGTTR